MKSSAEYKPSLAFGLLLQGPPKTGKTRILMGFPNVYIADCDNNLSGAARSFKAEYPDRMFRYDTIGVDDKGDVVPEGERWPRLLHCINAALKDPTVKTIGIDSISSVSDMLQAFIVANKGSGKKEGMTISDWIPFRNLLSKLVTDLRLTQRYLVVTSHEENVKDEASGALITRTNIPSKLADNFGAFFSDCWRTEIDELGGEPLYYVRSQPTKRYPSVGNSLGLPAQFKFDHSKILEYLTKGEK